MKFTCSQQKLSKALNTVSKAVSTRTTLPVLKGILLEAKEDGTIMLTASDLEISIQKKIEADVEVPGSAVVISKLFGDIIRKLPNEDISIEETEDNNIIIKTNSSPYGKTHSKIIINHIVIIIIKHLIFLIIQYL
jgi:DNA polymerase-3 subunit beta